MSSTYAVKIAVPDIPDEAMPADRAFLRGQFILNALFAAFGSEDAKPGTTTIHSHDIEAALGTALALLLATEGGFDTPKAMREAVDDIAKHVRKTAAELRERLTEADLAVIGAYAITFELTQSALLSRPTD